MILKSAKRIIKIDKIASRLNYLGDFYTLVKILTPQRNTINKFQGLIDKTHFCFEQKKLIKQTAHSLAVLHETYRDQDKYGRLYITREDIINAINLLQNELDLKNSENLLNPELLQFYRLLKINFGGRLFSRTQAQRAFCISKTHTQRQINELVDKELIQLKGKKKNAFYYAINEN